MKLLLSATLALGVAVLALLWWKSSRTEASRGAPDSVVSGAKSSTSSAEPTPIVLRTNSSSPGTAPTARSIATAAYNRDALHSKLQELLATKTGDSDRTQRLLSELAAMIDAANAEEIARALSPDELNSAFGAVALERWLDVDPRSAANWIAMRSDSTEEQAWVVARKLVATPGELRAFSTALPDSDFKQHLLFGGAVKVLEKNPPDAVALAMLMRPGAVQTNLLQTIAFDWSTSEPDKALAWMMTLPDPVAREGLVAVGAKAIAVTDPDLAAQWLSTAVKTESLLNDTALSLVESWAAKSPAEAAAWLTRFPAAEVREAGADIVARRWAESDPKAAGAWLAEFPEGEKVLAKWQSDEAKAKALPED